MYSMEIGKETIWFFDEEDLAECRVCHVKPIYKRSSGNSGDYIRCPKCGIKTGTSTSGLGHLVPVWNKLMVDGWEDLR